MKTVSRVYLAKLATLLITLTWLCPFVATEATARTFYNNAGKSIEAELIGMEDKKVIFKLKNGNRAKVLLSELAEADQLYVKSWWGKNKNRITESDVRLSISKKTSRIQKTKYTNTKNSRTKTSEDEISFACELNNYSKKTVSGLKASYSYYKRTSTRDKNGSNSHVDIINGSNQLDILPSHKSLSFTTDGVSCKDSSVKPVVDPRKPNAKGAERSSHSETVFGFVLTLSVDGKEILTQSHPENFLRLLAEEEKREERRSAENDDRQDRVDKGFSSRREREDIAREKRKNKMLKEKKEREAKRRREIEDRQQDYKDRSSEDE